MAIFNSYVKLPEEYLKEYVFQKLTIQILPLQVNGWIILFPLPKIQDAAESMVKIGDYSRKHIWDHAMGMFNIRMGFMHRIIHFSGSSSTRNPTQLFGT